MNTSRTQFSFLVPTTTLMILLFRSVFSYSLARDKRKVDGTVPERPHKPCLVIVIVVL
jgi:hypothetical protein